MNVWESVWSYKTVVVVVEADVSLLWRSGYNLWCFFRCKFLLVCAVQELLGEFLLIELHFGAANEGSGRWPKIITENWDAMSCSTWKTLFDCIFLPQLSWKLLKCYVLVMVTCSVTHAPAAIFNRSVRHTFVITILAQNMGKLIERKCYFSFLGILHFLPVMTSRF